MFISERPDNYEIVYQGLVERLAGAELAGAAADLGLEWLGEEALVPCLGREYLVGPGGVRARDGRPAVFTHRIVLSYYLMHGGRGENAGRFVPYRELPGGQDFARSLSTVVEGRLSSCFGGRLDQLREAGRRLGAQPPPEQVGADAAFVIPALPRVPLLLTFYDADEDFAAEAKVLYDLTALNFLDLECLAALGLMLAQELEAAARTGA